MFHQSISSLIRNKPVISLNPDNSIREAAVLMVMHRLGAIPVIEEGRLVGLFTERDLVSRVIKARLDHQISVAYVMTRDPHTISPDRSLVEALDLMIEQGLNYLLVATQEKVIGILSLREMLKESRELWNPKLAMGVREA
jgi:CBS domain-containing protein